LADTKTPYLLALLSHVADLHTAFTQGFHWPSPTYINDKVFFDRLYFFHSTFVPFFPRRAPEKNRRM
jgi:hypothetical protein